MFVNNYMSKYQAVSILVGSNIPTTREEPAITNSVEISYAMAKRTHLISGELISEDIRGYGNNNTKIAQCVIDLDNIEWFGMKRGFS